MSKDNFDLKKWLAVNRATNATRLVENTLKELSPELRNRAAAKAMQIGLDTDDPFDMKKKVDQYDTFNEVPQVYVSMLNPVLEYLEQYLEAEEANVRIEKIRSNPDGNINYIRVSFFGTAAEDGEWNFNVVITPDEIEVGGKDKYLVSKLSQPAHRRLHNVTKKLQSKELSTGTPGDEINENEQETDMQLMAKALDILEKVQEVNQTFPEKLLDEAIATLVELYNRGFPSERPGYL